MDEIWFDFKVIVVLLLVLFGTGYGCVQLESYVNAGVWKLGTGEIVKCKTIWQDECGMFFRDCENGQKYKCQTNVTRLR